MTFNIRQSRGAWDTKTFRFRVIAESGWNRPPYWKLFNPRKERCLEVHFRLGAGYIGGWTAFVAVNCMSRFNRLRPCLLQIGVTSNGNRIPYVRH